jgi:hypothetical protein
MQIVPFPKQTIHIVIIRLTFRIFRFFLGFRAIFTPIKALLTPGLGNFTLLHLTYDFETLKYTESAVKRNELH